MVGHNTSHTMKKIFNYAITIMGIASWMGVAFMLIEYSNCPILGWVIVIAPFVMLGIAIAGFIADERKRDAEFRKCFEPYANEAKANEVAIHNNAEISAAE